MKRLLSLALLWFVATSSAASAADGFGIGSSFELETHTGERFSSTEMNGRPWLLFFGFTHCPEVCPTTLFELTGALSALQPESDAIDAFFVTVDPERDTRDLLASYMGAFENRITALRGTADETLSVARSFRATYRKVPLEDGSYTMDHTAVVYLMDSNGNLFDTIAYLEDYDSQLEKLRRLLAGN